MKKTISATKYSIHRGIVLFVFWILSTTSQAQTYNNTNDYNGWFKVDGNPSSPTIQAYCIDEPLQTCNGVGGFTIQDLSGLKAAQMAYAIKYFNPGNANFYWGIMSGSCSTVTNPSYKAACEITLANVTTDDGSIVKIMKNDGNPLCQRFVIPSMTNTSTVTKPCITNISNISGSGTYTTNQTINLSADTPYTIGDTWSWTGPNGFTSNIRLPTISPVTLAHSGIYTVKHTFQYYYPDCSNTATLSINVTEACPTVTVTTNKSSYCKTQTINFNTVLSGGSGTPSYSWTKPGAAFTSSLQNPVITTNSQLSDTGMYNLAVTIGTCVIYTNISITVNDCVPTCVAPVVTLTKTDPTCFGTEAKNDGKINISGYSNATKYDYVLGAPPYSGTATYDSGSSPILAYTPIAATIPNPTSATDIYTVRVFNDTAPNCYADFPITFTKITCTCPAGVSCFEITATKN